MACEKACKNSWLGRCGTIRADTARARLGTRKTNRVKDIAPWTRNRIDLILSKYVNSLYQFRQKGHRVEVSNALNLYGLLHQKIREARNRARRVRYFLILLDIWKFAGFGGEWMLGSETEALRRFPRPTMSEYGRGTDIPKIDSIGNRDLQGHALFKDTR